MAILAACEQQSVLLPDETVTVSENTRRYVLGIRRVIPCGVDTARFTPGKSKEDRPTLLFVGTIHGRKRGRWLCEVFQQQVLPALPDAQLWCVSDPPLDAADFNPNIHFLGRVSEDALIDRYRRAWAFCLPSSYEGFGVPYIEAMASGLPVVATGNPGAMEVLAGGRYGKIAQEQTLGLSLISILSEATTRQRLAEVGLDRCATSHGRRFVSSTKASIRASASMRRPRSFAIECRSRRPGQWKGGVRPMQDVIFVAMENWDEMWRRNQPVAAGFRAAIPGPRSCS